MLLMFERKSAKYSPKVPPFMTELSLVLLNQAPTMRKSHTIAGLIPWLEPEALSLTGLTSY